MSFAVHQYWEESYGEFGSWYRVRDHFDLINGYPFKSDFFNLDGVGKPLVRIRDLLSNSLPTYFDGEDGNDVVVSDGDIVIGMDGDFNSVTWAKGEALLNQRVCALRAKKHSEVDSRILGYQIPISLKIINDLTPWSTVKHLSSLDVLSLRFPKLQTEVQREIADFLDYETARIDSLVNKRAKFAELVLERRLTFISKAINGMANSARWLETLPESWKAERAKVHFRESQMRSEHGEEELLTVSHLTGVTKRSEKDVYMFMAESNEGYKLVSPGDLIINTMWAWMGAMGVSSEQGLISPSYGVYSPVSEALRPAFVDLMVRSKPFVAEATRRSKGIHSSRLRLYPDAFLDMRLPIPPLEQQDEILLELSERTQREDELLQKNACAEALLREFRSALITAAVTGQIDVTTWGKSGQTDRRLDQIEEDMALREARA